MKLWKWWKEIYADLWGEPPLGESEDPPYHPPHSLPDSDLPARWKAELPRKKEDIP